MMATKPLVEIFGDRSYAWQLLEAEVKLQTSDNITGEDISTVLQLYMRGVEKMNSLVDIRESFFKNRVTALMSRPTVIRILNKPMSKKNKPDEVDTSSPVRKLDTKTQMHLKEKRKEMEMRLAYGAEEHNPDALRKIMAEQNNKESMLSSKIQKIVDSHEQRLMNRIKQRKLRTMTAKSRSDIFISHTTGANGLDNKERKEMMQKKRDEEQFGISKIEEESSTKPQEQPQKKRECRSLSPKRSRDLQQCESPSKRRISMQFSRSFHL